MKIVIIIAVTVAVILGAVLMTQQGRSKQRLQSIQADALNYSNQWQASQARLEERDKVIATLETNLTQRGTQLVTVSNELGQARTEMAQVQTQLKTTQTELEKKVARLAELEVEKDALNAKLAELSTSINTLEGQIAETKRKLATAEGNRDFLLKELKRMQDEKAILVTQFNNIATLRDQLAKLREEAAISQRISWTKQGIYQRRDMKGAEALISPAAPASGPSRRLDVEVDQTGARVVPPPTNAPASR